MAIVRVQFLTIDVLNLKATKDGKFKTMDFSQELRI